MIEIVPDTVKVYTKSIFSVIQFQLKESLESQTIPIGTSGWVLSEDEKYLATLNEAPSNDLNEIRENKSEQFVLYSKVSEVGNRMTQPKDQYIRKVMFRLDGNALDHIEDIRYKAKNNDVVIHFILNLSYLKHLANLGNFTLKSGDNGDSVIYTDQPTKASNPMILVSNDPSNQLLVYEVKRIRITHTIKSSDWVSEFQQPLGIGKFLVLEVPIPQLNDLRLANLTGDNKDFLNRLNRAYATIQEMEQELRKGEWGNTVAKLRNMELFKVNITKFIRKLIGDTTGVEEDKAGELTLAIDKLRSYASELHHVVDSHGNVKDVYTGGKEDAYMAYMLATSITNLLARKFVKLLNKEEASN